MWICGIWGDFVKNWYFVNNCIIEVRISKLFLHMCDTYNCDYLQHSTCRFNLIDFQLNANFPSQFFVFYRKITYSNWKQFQVFKIAKSKFKVTVHYYSLWAKCTQLWPLKKQVYSRYSTSLKRTILAISAIKQNKRGLGCLCVGVCLCVCVCVCVWIKRCLWFSLLKTNILNVEFHINKM